MDSDGLYIKIKIIFDDFQDKVIYPKMKMSQNR